MGESATMRHVPAAVRLGLWPVPLPLIALAIERLVRSIAWRHPALFERLGAHAGKRIALRAVDLPFVIALTLDPADPAVSVVRTDEGGDEETRICGPLAALIGLANGRYDGDALFFSGDLSIEGDIEAILALRNALDDAEIDLLQEGAALLGPLAEPFERVARPAAWLFERITGLPLTRGDVRPP